MTEEILKKIREESKKEIANLDEYNNNARLRNKLAIEEEIKASLGLSYNSNIYLPEKTEAEIVMDIYKKYAIEIEQEDTNNIYVYECTYKPTEYSTKEILEKGYPFEIETDITDPKATHRYYLNLEGFWSEKVKIEDCEEFEKKHTVLYVENFYKLQKEFITTAVNESQKKAVSKVLKKYY